MGNPLIESSQRDVAATRANVLLGCKNKEIRSKRRERGRPLSLGGGGPELLLYAVSSSSCLHIKKDIEKMEKLRKERRNYFRSGKPAVSWQNKRARPFGLPK